MRRRCAALFLVSASSLLLEIALTRVLSVATWYHFAFLVISLALLGFAAAGSYLAARPKSRRSEATAANGALLAAAGCLACVLAAATTTIDPFALGDWQSWLGLAAYESAIGAASFGCGLAVAAILSGWPQDSGALYAASLLGSAAACALAPALISLLAAQGAAAAAAALAAAGAATLATTPIRRGAALLAAAISIGAALTAASLFPVRAATSKLLGSLQHQGFVPSVTLHNAFSQVDAFETRPGEAVYAPGAPTPPSARTLAPQYLLVIDGDAVTPITMTGPLSALDALPSAAAYHLRPGAKTCVIGAGGGFDVLSALSVGKSKDVTAVEINPNVAGLVSGRYASFSGDLYGDRRVRLRMREGRAFLRADQESYDVIQLSLVDTWAAASRGAYGLTENYLYTVEAFDGYLEHLRPHGVLSVSRWLLRPANEALRLENLAIEALERANVAQPKRCFALVAGGRPGSREREVATLLAKREPFSNQEIDALKALCRRSGLRILYAPGAGGEAEFTALASRRRRFVAAYPLDLEAPTDDRPFFFQAYGIGQIASAWREIGVDRNAPSFLILLGALAETVALSALLIAWPLRAKTKAVKAPALLGAFACWGLGFMLFEIAALQKLALTLGSPVYAMAAALAALLLWAGVGSRLSAGLRSPKALARTLGALSAALLAEPFILGALPAATTGWTLPQSAALCALALAPAGVLMGAAVPAGLRLCAAVSPGAEAWAWAANGCLSVVGSALAALLSLSIGFDDTIRAAAAVYLLSLLAVLRLRR